LWEENGEKEIKREGKGKAQSEGRKEEKERWETLKRRAAGFFCLLVPLILALEGIAIVMF